MASTKTPPVTVPVQFQISLTQSSVPERDNLFHIVANDEVSGTRIFDMEISPENLALALSSRFCKATCNVWLDNPIGKKRETKSIRLHFLVKSITAKPDEIDAIVSPHEIDGWMVSNRSDIGNNHRTSYTNDGFEQTIIFERFVDGPASDEKGDDD